MKKDSRYQRYLREKRRDEFVKRLTDLICVNTYYKTSEIKMQSVPFLSLFDNTKQAE